MQLLCLEIKERPQSLSDSARPQTSTWPRGSGFCPVPSCRMDTCHACSVMEEFVPPGDLLSPSQHGTEQCPQPRRGTAICHSPSDRACCKESSAPQRLIHCSLHSAQGRQVGIALGAGISSPNRLGHSRNIFLFQVLRPSAKAKQKLVRDQEK